jgi:two-component system response regulator DesR
MKKLFLAEGETHVLDALRLLFEQQADYEVIGEARSAESLLARVCQMSPDAILLDWSLPGFHPQRSIPVLRGCCPAARLVALSVRPEHERIAIDYGVDGFISKQLPPEAFLSSLHAVIGRQTNEEEKTHA